MSKTIKLIPTNYSVNGDANFNNPENALTGVDDDTSAELSASGSTPGEKYVSFTKFVGPNGETVADLASKIGHVNSISFKTKYQADSATLPTQGIMVDAWGHSDAYSASSDPQIVEIPFNNHDVFSSADEYWQAAVEDDSGIIMMYFVGSRSSNTDAVVNIYGAEMEINYDPKGEPGKIDPNSSAEIVFGDTGSTKTYDVEVKDLRVKNGKLNGTAVGVAQKSFTGRLDQIKLSFTDVPFDGVGGGSGSGVETLVVTAESGDSGFTVTNTSMTFDELNEAVLDGKTVLCFFKSTSKNGFYTTPLDLSFDVATTSPSGKNLTLFGIQGISNASYDQTNNKTNITNIMYIELWWDRGDDLPTVRGTTYKVVSASDSGSGGGSAI